MPENELITGIYH